MSDRERWTEKINVKDIRTESAPVHLFARVARALLQVMFAGEVDTWRMSTHPKQRSSLTSYHGETLRLLSQLAWTERQTNFRCSAQFQNKSRGRERERKQIPVWT